MMENKFVSLLYPSEESEMFHRNRANLPSVTEEVCDELGLNEIFDLKTSSLTDYFTTDERVISYRQSTVRDLLSIPELLDTLSGIHPFLTTSVSFADLTTRTSPPRTPIYTASPRSSFTSPALIP